MLAALTFPCIFSSLSQDLRDFSFRSLADVAVTANQKQAAIDLIQNMNLMTAGTDDG